MRVVLDTSVFIARETGRAIAQLPPDTETAISVVTVAELRVGVLIAESSAVRGRRLSTLETAMRDHQALPVDDSVAEAFAALVVEVRSAGRNPRVLDSLIAATAVAHGAAVATQDDDFADLPGVAVVRV
ncbi:MAG: PIN domain-containing protein [Candidatus Dormibacteraeota bacterium]|nr:PIN domain-containing protein [Candidatus Dormibacteraeota bacterium]